MKHLFKPKVFNAILALLVLLLIIKTIWFAVKILWLPVKGVNEVSKQGSKALYYRVKLTPNEVAAPTVAKAAPVRQEGTIKDIKLLAIYNTSDVTIVTVEYKAKAKVLSRGEKINGFVLEGGGNNFATFSKNSKTYKVFLGKGKSSVATTSASSMTSSTQKTTSKSSSLGEITDAGDHRVIDRSLLEHYAKNMDDIYKNIGITEVKEGGAIKGFRITFVRKDSPFAKLGIRREDMIKSINGQEINSYNAAFETYKNIQDAENLTLVIQRGKEEMELEYEIN